MSVSGAAPFREGPGPPGETRSVGLSILWAILTLGIYTFYWTYVTYEEMRRYSGKGLRLVHPDAAGAERLLAVEGRAGARSVSGGHAAARSCLNARSTSRGMSLQMSSEPRTTAITVCPPRSTATARHPPARVVQPVLIPCVPG